MKIEVFKNLHKKAYSVRSKGRVIAYEDNLLISDAKLVVQPAGNARVRKEGKKYVHAFVRGTWNKSKIDTSNWKQVTYNPYKHTTFVDKDKQEPVITAKYVLLCKDGAYYLP